MVIHTFSNNDTASFENKSVILRFAGRRKVLSTSNLNGGISEELTYVFNNDCKPDSGGEVALLGETYEEHLRITARRLGLDDEKASGLCTSAYMENTAVASEKSSDFLVTAVVTAGVDHNGGRAGDPSYWIERNEKFLPFIPGTINILLHIDADLTDGAITRALVTCTEAKTTVLQELMAPSLYSEGIATGSGTDGNIIITDPGSGCRITEAGKHYKMGELIARAVRTALRQALYRQTGLNPSFQFGVLARLQRFGVTEESLWKHYQTRGDVVLNRIDFSNLLHENEREKDLVVSTSLFIHLLDQMNWNLLPEELGCHKGLQILSGMGFDTGRKQGTTCTKELLGLYMDGLISKIMN